MNDILALQSQAYLYGVVIYNASSVESINKNTKREISSQKLTPFFGKSLSFLWQQDTFIFEDGGIISSIPSFFIR